MHVQGEGGWREVALRIVVSAVIVATILYFWNFYILGPSDPFVTRFGARDLYQEHYPMVEYGFRLLREGVLPLWNPYQLCGIPFLAIAHTGTLYPGNLAYLLAGPGVATEITYVGHLLFAAFSMFWLVKRLGMGPVAGMAAAVTFALSGWMTYYAQQASLISGMCWLPLTVLLMHRTMEGSRYAPIGLAVAVACQLFNGAHEFFLFNLYGGTAFVLLHIARAVRSRDFYPCLRGLLALAAAGLVGAALAGVQLLPTLELVAQSARAPGSLRTSGTENPAWAGTLLTTELFDGVTAGIGLATVGFLPVVGLACGLRARRFRGLWITCGILGALSLTMALGGGLYDLYFSTPVGGLFRRPSKFLHLYGFAQAIMAALGAEYLTSKAAEDAGSSRPQYEWILVAVAMMVAASLAGPSRGLHLVLALAAMSLLLVTSESSIKRAAMGLVLALQATSLFQISDPPFTVPMTRPMQHEQIFDSYSNLLERFKKAAGYDRIHLVSSDIPGLTSKQAMMRGFYSPVDYEALVLGRQNSYLTWASGTPYGVIAGRAEIYPRAMLKLFQMMSVRYFIAARGQQSDRVLALQAANPKGEVKLVVDGRARVYESKRFSPRAYVVGTGRPASNGQEAMDMLMAANFNPAVEVVLEDIGDAELFRGARDWSYGSASIVRNEPKLVEVEVSAQAAGYLVLTDTYYPGWKAYVGGKEVPVLRANYLFRAIPVDPGLHRVTFVYEPGSLRDGAGLSIAGVSVLGLWCVAIGRRRHRQVRKPGLPRARDLLAPQSTNSRPSTRGGLRA